MATAEPSWTDGLATWYAAHGRHHLPWRLTTEPWAVLVSELMLQQTSVARVLPRWERLLARWPSPASCAAASLDDVLREWEGLGYPRRARALWLTAAIVDREGWPADEPGLRALPGVGVYTARALLAFSDLGTGDSPPPRDVNLGRVAARAALGVEPHQVTPGRLDAVLTGARPVGMPVRQYAYALFDVGALHCRAVPRCQGCGLAAGCAALRSGLPVVPPPPRQAAYQGSLRQLRGALLAAALAADGTPTSALRTAVSSLPGATEQRIELALAGLVADGLVRDDRDIRYDSGT